MTTGLIYDERFTHHRTGPGHPERPARLHAILNGLRHAGLLDECPQLAFEAATVEAIARLHDPVYVARVGEVCAREEGFVDVPDSVICAASYDVACLAVGGALRAVDAVVSGEVSNAFCISRPPGHHAEADRSMGFCLFNNIALAAEHAVREHGLQRIAIVDFDVHHGNGTQHFFDYRSDVLFVSLHRDPASFYPGTGFAHEKGQGEGKGYTLNLPIAAHSGDRVWLELFEGEALAAVAAYRPQLLLVSAGFDAATNDPLGGMAVTSAGFAQMMTGLLKLAKAHCGGRLVAVLEGGYDLDALAEGATACIEKMSRA